MPLQFNEPGSSSLLGNNSTLVGNGAFSNQEFAPWTATNDLLPLLTEQIRQAYARQPNQIGAIDQFSKLATPQGRQQQTLRYGAGAANQSFALGKMIGAKLRAAGLGQNAEAGAMLDAGNKARQATTEYANQNESPESLIKSLSAISQANDPSNIISLLGPIMNLSQLIQSGKVGNESIRPKGGGDMLGGVLGQLAGGLDWGKIFNIG